MKRNAFPAICLSFLLIPLLALRAEDQFFDSDGVKLHYTIQGEGKPLAGLADSLDRGDLSPLIEALTPKGAPKRSAEQIKASERFAAAARRNDLTAIAAVVRGNQQLVVTEQGIRANRVPTLALIGDADPFKWTVDALVGMMPNLRVVVIRDADHGTAKSKPEFIQGLKKFLAGIVKQPN